MILFKAIKRKSTENTVKSESNNEFFFKSSWEDLITSAFTHISHGDSTKDKKDCWISTTKSYDTALKYLNDSKYDFNGIAMFELSKTHKTGYIYDKNLRENGYIDRQHIHPNTYKNIWTPNEDGIVTALDMSDELTIGYLSSHLWLKGNKKTLGNIRSQNYAISDDEVLLLGEDIKFNFIGKDKANELSNKSNYALNIIPNHHTGLYKLFIDYILNSERKSELKENLKYKPGYMTYSDFYSQKINNIKYDTGFANASIECLDDYLDQEDLVNEYNKYKDTYFYDKLMEFYENAKFCFDKDSAYKRFTQFHELDYADRDTIDFEAYEAVVKLNEIHIDSYLYAYAYSFAYLFGKNTSKQHKFKELFYSLNIITDNLFISYDVNKDHFFEKYNKSLGLFSKLPAIDYSSLDLDDLF